MATVSRTPLSEMIHFGTGASCDAPYLAVMLTMTISR